MILTVRLFARLRELAEADAVQIDLPDGATVEDLRQSLGAQYPRLAALLPRCAVAVDTEFADAAQVLQAGAEVALLPPVSGG